MGVLLEILTYIDRTILLEILTISEIAQKYLIFFSTFDIYNEKYNLQSRPKIKIIEFQK